MGDKVLAGALFVSAFVFILTIIFNALAAVGEEGLFTGRTSDVSKLFPTLLTPAGWTFTIWSIIYVWLALSITFLISNIYRKKHTEPAVFNLGMCSIFIINLTLNICWLFVWDRKNTTASCVILFFIAITNWILLGILSKRLMHSEDELNMKDIWLYRLLPQNGLATYTTWTTIAALVNLSVAIHYPGGEKDVKVGHSMETLVNMENPGDLVSVALLSFFFILWIPLENYVYFERFRFVFTPYLVVVWALAGVYSNLKTKYEDEEGDGIYIGLQPYVATLLGICIFVCVARLLFIVYVHFKGHPIKKSSSLRITKRITP